MKVNKRDIFAAVAVLLLAAALFVGAGAAAASEMPAANDGVITLDDDVNLSSQYLVTDTLTLNLNGHTITYTGEASLPSGVIGVKYGGDLTINGPGFIVSGDKAYAAIAMTIKDDVYSDKEAKLTVNGGELTGTCYGIVGNGNRHHTEITINGGTIKGTMTNDCSGIYNPQNGKLTINGGTIEGASGIYLKAGEVTTSFTAGTIKGTGTKQAFVHSGNGFNPTGAALVVENCGYPGGVPNLDIKGGTFISENTNAVESYGYESYPMVDDFITGGSFTDLSALKYAASGAIITLAGNLTLTTDTTIPAGVTVTVPADVELVADHLVVAGKLIVEGTLNITSNNTLVVVGDATVDISGIFTVPTATPGCVELGANAQMTLPTGTTLEQIADYITKAETNAEIIVPPTEEGNTTVYTFTANYTKPTDGDAKAAIQQNTKVTVGGSTVVTLDVDSEYEISVPASVVLVKGGDAYGIGVSVNNKTAIEGKTLKLILDTDATGEDKDTFQLTNGSATADYKIYKGSKSEKSWTEPALQGRNHTTPEGNVVLSKGMETIVPETTDLKFTQSGGALAAGQYTGTLTFTVVVIAQD